MTPHERQAHLPRTATLHTHGWGGYQQQPCIVVGETPKRYRVCAPRGRELRLLLRGKGLRIILSSGTYLVRKFAVTFDEKEQS